MATTDLTALIEPLLGPLGVELWDVEESGGVLRVAVDRPGGIDLDAIAAATRAVSGGLDEADPIDHAYRLEVSSPGIDRPLTRPADYVDWAGHEARIRLAAPLDGRKQFEGVLQGVEDGKVRIAVPRAGTVALPLDLIANAKLILTDALIRATAPLSTAGVDRISMEG